MAEKLTTTPIPNGAAFSSPFRVKTSPTFLNACLTATSVPPVRCVRTSRTNALLAMLLRKWFGSCARNQNANKRRGRKGRQEGEKREEERERKDVAKPC